MKEIDFNSDGTIVPPQKLRFSFWKLAALAIFSYYFIDVALNFYSFHPVTSRGAILYEATVPIHEFGHGLFIYFRASEIMISAGGTLLQLGFPAFFVLYFLFTEQKFSAAIANCWLGANIIFVSSYMSSAVTMEGVYFNPVQGITVNPSSDDAGHDWNYMFSYLGILQYTDIIARVAYCLGFLVIISGIIFGILSSRKSSNEF